MFDDKNKAKVDLFYIKVLDEIVKGAPSLKKIMLYSEKEFYRNYITSRFMRRSLTSFFFIKNRKETIRDQHLEKSIWIIGTPGKT